MRYEDFVQSKILFDHPSGHEPGPPNPMLYPFQRDIVRWAIRRGRAAIFADCGLGKTPMQLDWAMNMPGNVLILAPLAVSKQTMREGKKFGIEVKYCRDQSQVDSKITITNYEMMEHFDPEYYTGIILDESSILKSYSGKFRNSIIEAFRKTPYKLACTATPAPNDYMELGNHAEFLGAMTRTEMLSMFFCHDGGDTAKWRIKGHAENDFWKWICSWAVMVRMPEDLGYDNDGFVLPEIKFHDITVKGNAKPSDMLFAVEAMTLQERQGARRDSLQERAEAAAKLANKSKEAWLIWCNLNSEGELAERLIPDSCEVRGNQEIEFKEQAMMSFVSGELRVLISKPSIAGFGMNFQHCHNMIFLGLSDSYEQFYQAFRRCWRFGQKHPVNVYIITADTEGCVVSNIKRKEEQAAELAKEMVVNMKDITISEMKGARKVKTQYKEDRAEGDLWEMHLGDCIETIKNIDDGTVDYTIFSPPFSSLYTYSDLPQDMGNSKNDAEFWAHFKYLIPELFRVTKEGRNLSFHCMNLPLSKERDGVVGLKDFRGDLIRAFQAEGWIYHSEVCIWKDPVTAVTRTKALGLLHKQLKKDSCRSRMGIPDYVVTMRKPGVNPDPVTHTNETFPVPMWQQWASPIWMDINPSNTLQRTSAREERDERHICPLQLDVIERCLILWSNPGNLVLSPFAGIGSEGYQAVLQGRRFVGCELKESYYEQACKNLEAATAKVGESMLFDMKTYRSK